MHLQRQYSRVDIDHLQSSVLHRILHIWRGKRAGRPYPRREDLRPHDFAPDLRYLSLARVVESGKDFEIRIVGDEIVQAYGENFTGKTLAPLAGLIGDAMMLAYKAVAQGEGPMLLQGSFERTHNDHFHREVILMPLGSNGKVEFVLSAGMLMPRGTGTDREAA